MLVGLSDATNVTEPELTTDDGVAVTRSCGGSTITDIAFDCAVPFTVVKTVSVPDRVKGLRHARVGPTLFGTKWLHAQGEDCVANAGTQLVESMVHGTSRPSNGPPGEIDAVTVTVSP